MLRRKHALRQIGRRVATFDRDFGLAQHFAGIQLLGHRVD